MKHGTRRMWARRMLRAGWLIAPLFSMPRRAYHFFLCDDATKKFDFGALCITSFCLGCLFGMVSCTRTVINGNTIATQEHVTEYLKGDPCMIEMMPRWLKKQERALSVYDLEEAKASCRNAFEAHYAKAAQKEAMTLLGGKK